MGTFLITGNPGAGKTSIADELSRRGLIAVDADLFAAWESPAGNPVDQPAEADDGWLLNHRWVWRLDLVERFIGSQPAGRHVFMCGIAMNQRAMLHCFDEVFLLTLDHRHSCSGLTQRTTRIVALHCGNRSSTADRCFSRRWRRRAQ